jgi:glucose/arabinose dehydrogenase
MYSAYSSVNLLMILLFMLPLVAFNESIYADENSVKIPEINDPSLSVEIVYQGISFPTSMAFLGPDDILVLEKDQGTVVRIVNGTMIDKPIFDAAVSNKGERGMLGIAVSEEANNGDEDNREKRVRNVFLYYSESATGKDEAQEEPLGNRLYRYELEDDEFLNQDLLLDLPANSTSGYHVGGKLVMDSNEDLYLVAGDMDRDNTETQNIDKQRSVGTSVIYRITMEGEPISDNPLGRNEPLDKFFAYGIRNSFGMDFDPMTGSLWNTENGFVFNDEINLVEPGFNSGWKKVQGMSYLEKDFSLDMLVDFDGNGKYSDPEFVWNRTVGPTALRFLDSEKYGEEYRNDLFVGDVNNGNLYHFDLNGERTELDLHGVLEDKVANTAEELESIIWGKGFGGIVDMTVGPDGYLYVLTIAEFGELKSSLEETKAAGTIFRIVPRQETLG